jgi:hypothetical protein
MNNRNSDKVTCGDTNNFKQLVHTFIAGSIEKGFHGHADCKSCNLKQTDVDAFIEELAKMGSVEKFW